MGRMKMIQDIINYKVFAYIYNDNRRKFYDIMRNFNEL